MKGNMARIKYIVPSAFTFGSVLCGCYVVVSAIRGFSETSNKAQAAYFFVEACRAIGLAIILDNIDGRIARKIGATTAFGTELDSIADALTFGGAASILMYLWSYSSGFDFSAILVSFIFVACGAARLARSNLRSHSLRASNDHGEERYFVGLPIPAAAGMIAAFVYFVSTAQSQIPRFYLLPIGILLALLMVSTIPYSKLKIGYERRNSMPAILNFLVFPTLAALIALVVWLGLRWLVLAAAILYVAHGPVWSFLRLVRPHPLRTSHGATDH